MGRDSEYGARYAETGTANEAFLIKLRAQLALRRSEFSEAQNSFPARLAILEEQLAALGPRQKAAPNRQK